MRGEVITNRTTITFNDKPYASYELALEAAELETLDVQREKLRRRFFQSMCNSDHRLNYLLVLLAEERTTQARQERAPTPPSTDPS